MMYLNLAIIAGAGAIGFLIGREKRIVRYLDEIENLRSEKKYWIDICNRQKKELEVKPYGV